MKRILATTAIVALTAMPAFAQTTTTPDTAEVTTTDMLDLSGPQVAPADLINRSVYASSADMAPGIMPDSIDEPAEDWDNVGSVDDLVLTPDGEIAAIVLDIGGFFGIGAKPVSVSMDEITLVNETGSEGEFFVVYNGPSADLEDLPELDRTAVNDEGNSFHTAGNTAVGSDEGLTEDAVTDVPVSPETDDATESDLEAAPDATTPVDDVAVTEDDEANLQAEDRANLTADDLQGTTLYDMSGEQIGNISDVVLAEDGQVADVVISIGGFLGIGAKSVAVPFDDITVTREDGAMTSSLRATTMITADQFDTMEEWDG